MAVFEWNESYSVKVGILDAQHKKLFQIVQELQDAMKAGHGKDKASDVLRRLIEYTVYHFSAEEKLMENHAYPTLAEHRAEHKALTDKVIQFKKDYEAGNGSILPLMTFLQDWLKHHILTVDQKYSGFMNTHGVR